MMEVSDQDNVDLQSNTVRYLIWYVWYFESQKQNRKHKPPVSMFVLKLQKYCTSIYNIFFTYFEGMYSI